MKSVISAWEYNVALLSWQLLPCCKKLKEWHRGSAQHAYHTQCRQVLDLLVEQSLRLEATVMSAVSQYMRGKTCISENGEFGISTIAVSPFASHSDAFLCTAKIIIIVPVSTTASAKYHKVVNGNFIFVNSYWQFHTKLRLFDQKKCQYYFKGPSICNLSFTERFLILLFMVGTVEGPNIYTFDTQWKKSTMNELILFHIHLLLLLFKFVILLKLFTLQNTWNNIWVGYKHYIKNYN